MSSLKPDYFITHNGLPNIIQTNNNTRHLIRHATKTNARNRVNNEQKSLSPHTNSGGNKNIQQVMEVHVSNTYSKNMDTKKRQSLRKSAKDLINKEIKDSLNKKLSIRNSSNTSVILTSQKYEADNECNRDRNFKRNSKEVDNKCNHQRKYDNKIFRHDIPDRIVLPPLPI